MLFDFDGTLADSAEWFAGHLNGVARRFGFREIDEAEMEAMRSLDTREIVRRLRVPLWRLPAIARHLRALALAENGRIGLFPEVADAVEVLAARGARLGVVSSNSEPHVRAVLGPRLAGLMRHYGCGARLSGKAAKLRRAARALGTPASRCVYVGDERRDLIAARAAGLASAAVAWGYATPEALAAAGPTLTLTRVEEIAAL